MTRLLAEREFPSNCALAAILSSSRAALRIQAERAGVDLSLSGTTLSLCVVDAAERLVFMAWVGDSAFYLVDGGGGIQSLTSDSDPRSQVVRRPRSALRREFA